MQANDESFPDLPPAAACMKHFIAYSTSRTGHDRSPIELSDRNLRQLYEPPFRAAVEVRGHPHTHTFLIRHANDIPVIMVDLLSFRPL